MKHFSSILFFIAVFYCSGISAQSKETAAAMPPAVQKKVATTTTQVKSTLDTEESFKYLGNQLLFQMKKRLNLTTEEDEKKQEGASKNKKFSFFGIEVERE